MEIWSHRNIILGGMFYFVATYVESASLGHFYNKLVWRQIKEIVLVFKLSILQDQANRST